ncbi:hypothetical protein O3P69_008751 [Scylla paramamosain]|uniref:Uncharacterized protein n=1 Tax=Scylla paramamosain TaxID=85552 RepID=A0AAW0SLM0_SCYPA
MTRSPRLITPARANPSHPHPAPRQAPSQGIDYAESAYSTLCRSLPAYSTSRHSPRFSSRVSIIKKVAQRGTRIRSDAKLDLGKNRVWLMRLGAVVDAFPCTRVHLKAVVFSTVCGRWPLQVRFSCMALENVDVPSGECCARSAVYDGSGCCCEGFVTDCMFRMPPV